MNGKYQEKEAVEKRVRELLKTRGDGADDLLKAEVKRLEEGGKMGRVVEDVNNWRIDEADNTVVKDMWFGICRNLARNGETEKVAAILEPGEI